MSKDEIQKVILGTNEALRVTADGEFIWHPEADAMIENSDFTSSPAMRHILRALRKALVAPVQDTEAHYKGVVEGVQKLFDDKRAQRAPVPDYAWPTVADYEKDVGFAVNDTFKAAWSMARTTNDLFTQMGNT